MVARESSGRARDSVSREEQRGWGVGRRYNGSMLEAHSPAVLLACLVFGPTSLYPASGPDLTHSTQNPTGEPIAIELGDIMTDKKAVIVTNLARN